MVNRLRAYKDSYLLFISDYDAPFTIMRLSETCVHVRPSRKFQDVSVLGKVSWTIAKSAVSSPLLKNEQKTSLILCLPSAPFFPSLLDSNLLFSLVVHPVRNYTIVG